MVFVLFMSIEGGVENYLLIVWTNGRTFITRSMPRLLPWKTAFSGLALRTSKKKVVGILSVCFVSLELNCCGWKALDDEYYYALIQTKYNRISIEEDISKEKGPSCYLFHFIQENGLDVELWLCFQYSVSG